MNNARNRAFDMAKVLATIFILFHHYQQVAVVVTGKNVDTVVKFYGGTFNWGRIVELFFLMSGYFMLAYVEKIPAGLTFYQFYTRRAARLLPLMCLSSVFCAVAELAFDKAYRVAFFGVDPTLFGVFLQSLGIQAGWSFSNPFLNNPTWYCSVLMLCYLIFYAVVYWSHRLRVSPCYGFAFMVFLGCSVQTSKASIPFFNDSSSRGYVAFFSGVLFAILMPYLKKWRGAFLWELVFLAVFAAVYHKKSGQLQYMPFLLVFILYPTILLLLQHVPFTVVSQWPFWEKWARIGYSVFVWHLPFYVVLYTVVKAVGIDPLVLVNWKSMLLCAIAMQLIGWISYRFLEKPLNRKVLKIFANLDPAQKAGNE